MNCPQCGDDGYSLGGTCSVCQWKPNPDDDLSELNEAPAPTGTWWDPGYFVASIVAGLIFFALFYVVGSRGQNDWFTYKSSDILAAAILSVIGYVGVMKAKD